MSKEDRLPLDDAPATDRIKQKANNRLGAVYSALYSFWSARHAAVTSSQETTGARRDAYSVIMFNTTTETVVTNDVTSSPDELLDIVLNTQPESGTNFAVALQAGQAVMVDNWNTERSATLAFIAVRLVAVVTLLIPYYPQNTYHDIPLRWRMSATRYGRPRSLSLRNPPWVAAYLIVCKWCTNWLVRRPLSFHSVSFGEEWDSTVFDSRRVPLWSYYE